MRISVNLASRPFVELRPFFLRLRIIMAVLLVAGLGVAIASHHMQKKLDVAEAQMDDLRNHTIAIQQEKQRNEARMRQPVNALVLDRSHFLNALFLRKSFSWTAVMMDLENVLPIGVQVTSIEPQITVDGDVVIKLRVSGDRDRAVQLVRNLERSRRFLVPRLNGEQLQAKETNGNTTAASAANAGLPGAVEFEILANYNPLPEGEAFSKPKAVRSEGEHADASGSPSNRTAARSRVPASPAKPGPHDGIVLKPYVAPRPSPAVPQTSLQAPAQGGPR